MTLMRSELDRRERGKRGRNEDDPRPGGDGGRRERLRGGRADPTQRSRGGATAEGLPQCPDRDITHGSSSRSTRRFLRQNNFSQRDRLLETSMPEASARVEWRAPQHAGQSRPHDTPRVVEPTGTLPDSGEGRAASPVRPRDD